MSSSNNMPKTSATVTGTYNFGTIDLGSINLSIEGTLFSGITPNYLKRIFEEAVIKELEKRFPKYDYKNIHNLKIDGENANINTFLHIEPQE